MENLKSTLFLIIIILVIGIIGYWAVATLQSGPNHLATEEVERLKQENEALKKEAKSLNNELSGLQSEVKEEAPSPVIKEEVKPIATEKPKTEPTTTTYKNQTLINELQKLIDANVFMKLKSVGTRVGSVQKFLNLYFKTSLRIDNDYGEAMKKRVMEFQKDQGLTADGEAGPSTFRKMIEWLKKQG